MLEKIIEILDNHFVFDDQDISLESDLRSELYLDDDDMENLVIALEDEFDLELQDIAPDYLFTVEDILNLITKKIAEK